MAGKPQNLVKRFWSKVRKTPNGCWLWTACLNEHGYGVFELHRRTFKAHRISYVLLKGQIPEGLELDHVCRNPKCVNPGHLEPVTHRENILRGDTVWGIAARRPTCVHGHLLSGHNLYIRPNGSRNCLQCKSNSLRRYRQRLRGGALSVTL